MKFKSLYLLGIAALAFSACDDTKVPEYVPAPESPVGTVYFNDIDKKAFTVGETATEVQTLAYRPAAGTNETYPLSVKIEYTDPETQEVLPADNLFTFPTTVTFEANSVTAPIVIGFDVNQLIGGIPYRVALSLGDIETPYYSQSTNLTIRYAPWEDLIVDGENTGKLYDCFLNTLANIGEFYNEVRVQESPVMPGFYRVINPYQPGNPAGYIWPADEEYDGDYYMYINATDPAKVFISTELGELLEEDGSAAVIHTGVQINFSDGLSGEILAYPSANFFASRGADEEEYSQYYGKLVNGVITFPNEQSFLITCDMVYPSLYYADAKEFKLMLPGASDPNKMVWEELGDATFTDGFLGITYGLVKEPESWTVTIEEGKNQTITEGYYRLKNPWKDGVCPYGVDYDDDVYIEIDATNPDCVYVKDQFTGFADEEDGELWIANYAGYTGKEADELIEAGAVDVLKNDVITFGIGIPLKGLEKYSRLFGFFPKSPSAETQSNIYPTKFETTVALPGSAADQIRHRIVTRGASFVGRPDAFRVPNPFRGKTAMHNERLRYATSF